MGLREMGEYAVAVPRWEWRESERTLPGGGVAKSKTRVQIGEEPGKVAIYVDVDRIASMLGVRAAKSKGGRSSYLGGAVVVRRLAKPGSGR